MPVMTRLGRSALLPVLLVLATTGCAATSAGFSAATGAVPPFSDVTPRTNTYLIALEGTGLARTQGEERLYNLGRNACSALDKGRTVESQVTALATEARLGREAGSVVGAAVAHMCPQHTDAAKAYVEQSR
jgi:hypothetical protein